MATNPSNITNKPLVACAGVIIEGSRSRYNTAVNNDSFVPGSHVFTILRDPSNTSSTNSITYGSRLNFRNNSLSSQIGTDIYLGTCDDASSLSLCNDVSGTGCGFL